MDPELLLSEFATCVAAHALGAHVTDENTGAAWPLMASHVTTPPPE
jgi:hypothetical protein